MSDMNFIVKDMANKIVKKRMAERELLIAKFITENPHIKAENIVLVEQNTPTGIVFSVRTYTEAEKIERDMIWEEQIQ